MLNLQNVCCFGAYDHLPQYIVYLLFLGRNVWPVLFLLFFPSMAHAWKKPSEGPLIGIWKDWVFPNRRSHIWWLWSCVFLWAILVSLIWSIWSTFAQRSRPSVTTANTTEGVLNGLFNCSPKLLSEISRLQFPHGWPYVTIRRPGKCYY